MYSQRTERITGSSLGSWEVLFHFADDLDPICFAQGRHRQRPVTVTVPGRGPDPWVSLASPSKVRARRPGQVWSSARGDTAGHGYRIQIECDLLFLSMVLGLGWGEEQRGHSAPTVSQQTPSVVELSS